MATQLRKKFSFNFYDLNILPSTFSTIIIVWFRYIIIIFFLL